MSSDFKDLNVKVVLLNSVKPHPRNARMHDEVNINAIMESIKEFGQRTPIVIGKRRRILKGCGTWEAMKRLGFRKLAVVEALRLTNEQELAYALADNKTSDMSEFDYSMITETLSELNAGGYDLSKTGFRDFEQRPLLAADWKPDIDEDEDIIEHPDELKALFKFENEEFNIVKRAIKLCHELNHDLKEYKDSEIILYILQDYIATNRRNSTVRRKK